MTGRGREIKNRRKKGEGLDEIGDEIGVETPKLGVSTRGLGGIGCTGFPLKSLPLQAVSRGLRE